MWFQNQRQSRASGQRNHQHRQASGQTKLPQTFPLLVIAPAEEEDATRNSLKRKRDREQAGQVAQGWLLYYSDSDG